MIPRSKNLFLLLVILSVSWTLNGEVQVDIDNDAVMVNTSAGKAVGYRLSTSWGNVIRFYAIPYAEPLTKSKRFEPSIPLLGQEYSNDNLRNNILHGSEGPPPACIQQGHLAEFSHPSIHHGGLRTSENCLMLNIYQPVDMISSESIPIVLWVPGDGYSFADSIQYDGSALATKGKVIVITMNYRVGIFGFASMKNSTLPGNAALTDIVSALKFILHNAQEFNGDPNRITLGGRFSGAMAISTLITSDLFYRETGKKSPLATRVILHGGAASTEYNVDSNPLEGLQKLAVATGCYKGDGQHTLTCLQMLDNAVLLEKASKIGYSWRPAIDGINILKNPINTIKFDEFSSKINFLIGDNSGSGSLCYTSQKYQNSKFLDDFSEDSLKKDDFVTLATANIKEFYEENVPQLSSLASHEYYYRTSQNGVSSWRDSYFRFCGALYIRTPVEMFARYVSRRNSIVYRYEYAYRASSSISPPYFQGPLGDEIIFTFPTKSTTFNTEDTKVFNIFIDSWANFIKNGNPSSETQKWDEFNEMNKNLIGITENGVKKSTSEFLDQDVHFWRDVFVPMSSALAKVQKTDTSSCPMTVGHKISSRGGLGFFSMFLIVGVIALSLVFVVYLVRNWQKPYLFKFG